MKQKFVDLLSEGTSMICKRSLRRWEIVQAKKLTGRLLRVCSYNVLCQETIALTMNLFSHLRNSRMAELEWSFRSKLLKREFSMIEADVFCLQEVQNNHFQNFYQPLFAAAGYQGLFKKRTRKMVDGCAIFFKNDLELCNSRMIEYFVSPNCVLNRDNVGQIVRLRDRQSKKEFCIANTHLLFNKRRGDVKLAQLAVLFANLDNECGTSSDRKCPYILCGDFNIQPYCPLYNFIMDGKLSSEHLRCGEMSGQGERGGRFLPSNILPADSGIGYDCRLKNTLDRKSECFHHHFWNHPLQLASVYSHVDAENMPEISTFHSVEAANPDFMFYSINFKNIYQAKQGSNLGRVNVCEDSLRLIQRLSLPNVIQLQDTLGPWPNSFTPSDHIPLIADFILE